MVTIIIGHSQQRGNRCKMGDTEFDHTRSIMHELIALLSHDGLVKVVEMPDTPAHLTNDPALNKQVANQRYLAKKCQNESLYYLTIHTNAYNNETHGVEAITYPGNEKSRKMALAIVKEIENLGIKNRGQYTKNSFAELKRTIGNAIILECWFHDNIVEAKWGHENIYNVAKAIKNGIYTALGLSPLPNPKTDESDMYRFLNTFEEFIQREKIKYR